MTKKVVIYTRVSTEDQAEYGTSLRDQDRVLRKWCSDKGYEILGHYSDDCSGKTFDRPEFKQFICDVATKKVKPKMFLVSRKDRFSRNALAALNMIEELRSMGIEFRAIDSPSYTDNPESMLPDWLGFILPEIENRRRGLNTLMGMRQAQREGRWVANAPLGYEFDRSGKKALLIPGKYADLVCNAFEEVLSQRWSVNEVRRRMNKQGVKVSRSQIYKLLRNPVYIGKIRIKAYLDEPEEIVEGLHQPIVQSSLFWRVQDLLDGKSKRYIRSDKRNVELPLRGHLICPQCGKLLTGSGSTNNQKRRYWYYHCQNGCGERNKAADVNEAFSRLLESFKIPKTFINLYKEILTDVINSNLQTKMDKIKGLDNQIQQYEDMLADADDKYMEKKLSDTAYTRIVAKCNKKIDELHSQQVDVSLSDCPLEDYLQSGMTLLINLPQYYSEADVDTRSMIVSSIFPEKLIYDGDIYRTPKLNAFISRMTSDIKVYTEREKEKALISENLSTVVAPTRIELVSKV